jgi:hypothetical protein
MDKRTELLIKSQNEVIRLKEELRKLNIEYELEVDKFNAMEIDRDYWQSKWQLIQKGAVGLWCNETRHILRAFPILNDFETTFPHDLDYSKYDNPLYKRFPYEYVDEKGNIKIDTEQHKKYKLGGIL